MIEQKLIDFIATTVTERAAKAKIDAGYSGSWGDGGASEMKSQLTFWLLGLSEKVPAQYEKIVKEYEKQQLKEIDSDYQLFLKLKEKYKKFGV